MKQITRSFYERAVRQALEHVVASLDEALELERLARGAALSPFHFHRVFRGMVGETPLQLHRRLRLERAAWCLIRSDVSVTSLALDAGYDSHEAFTRVFRDRYGRSPSELRQSREDDPTSCTRPQQFELAARSGIHYRPDLPEGLTIHLTREEQTMSVEIKKMPAMRIAAVEHVGPYHRISEAFQRLHDPVRESGLVGPATTMLAIYHDDPETTPESELRSEAAVTVHEDALIPEGLTERRLPAGRYAVATHVGPYSQLGDAWARLMGQWLPDSGERVGEGSSYEIYRSTPADAPEHELRTELYVPLA